MMNQSLVVCDTAVKTDKEGRFCLNDLHRASGGNVKSKPANWTMLSQTKELISELGLIDGIPAINSLPGRTGGTYVVKELVYAYAMWISAKFHLQVIRAYDALVTGAQAVRQLPHDFKSALKCLLVEVEKNEVLESENLQLVLEHKAKDAKLEEVKPKVEMFDAAMRSEDLTSISNTAKVLNMGIGPINLFRWLREQSVLMAKGYKKNVPYQPYIDRGYFKVIEYTYQKDETDKVQFKTLVTQKGMDWIRRKLAEAGFAPKLAVA